MALFVHLHDNSSWHVWAVVSQILSLFKQNKHLVRLELARAETLPDDVWNRNAEEEAGACRQQLKEAQSRFEAGEGTRAEVKSLKRKVAQLEKEETAAYAPQFPAVRTLLILGILAYRGSRFLHHVGFRPWNSPPDWGAWEVGCAILNLTDRSFAFVVPSLQECSWAKKSTYDALKLRPLSGEQYLKAFASEDEYYRPVRASGDAAPATIMPMAYIQAAWPSFPHTYTERENGADDEDGDDNPKPDSSSNIDDDIDKCIFRDETKHTAPEPNDDRRRATMKEEERRKLDIRIQELLSNYTKNKLKSHRFDDDFSAHVDVFIRSIPGGSRPKCQAPCRCFYMLRAISPSTAAMCHGLT